jgi:tetratricopeptide (TPR) repeat protein
MIAVAALLVAGCGRKKDGGGAGSAREEPRAAIAAKQPADPNVIFRDDKGREIKREDLKDVSGAVEWELVGGDHVPEAAQTLHEQARAAGSSGDYPKAIALFKQAHDAAPAWPYPLYELGFTYELMGEPVKALAEYERVIALAPRGYFTVLASADCLRREAAKEWASGLCKRYALAEFMFGDERTAELKAIAVAAPRMPGPQKDLALDIRDDAQRLAAIDKALGVSPDPETRGVLLSNKGLTLASLGRKDEAIAVLGALVLDPASPLDVIEMSKMGLVQLTTPQRP